jgi:hypothetical protein
VVDWGKAWTSFANRGLRLTEPQAAAPCLHAGSPRPVVIQRAADAIKELAAFPDVLAKYGISANEFESALPAAIESIRGSKSASNASSRNFLTGLLEHLADREIVSGVTAPSYGADTVYRVDVEGIGAVAIIQKGCPDGAHSSTNWSIPDWAEETYLWWLCSSMSSQPGEHITKGVNRLRNRFFSDLPGTLSGVIFQNELCGSFQRSCPKQKYSADVGSRSVPAPCIYKMPERDGRAQTWNWTGDRALKFPAVLLSAFGILPSDADSFVGFVGFQRKDNGSIRTTITTRFGAGRSSTHRN